MNSKGKNIGNRKACSFAFDSIVDALYENPRSIKSDCTENQEERVAQASVVAEKEK